MYGILCNQWVKAKSKTVASLVGIDKTGRRYTKLLNGNYRAGVSNDKIAAITGHKSEQTLRDYAIADMEGHQKISKILSSKKSDVVAVLPVRKVCSTSANNQQDFLQLSVSVPPQFVFNN